MGPKGEKCEDCYCWGWRDIENAPTISVPQDLPSLPIKTKRDHWWGEFKPRDSDEKL